MAVSYSCIVTWRSFNLCVGIVLELEPVAVISVSYFRFQRKIGYLFFPTSETLGRMSTSFGLSDIWDRAFGWTSDGYSYEWLLVFKAAISQSAVTLVHLNGPRNLCAESLYPFSLYCSGEGNYVYYAGKILCVQCLSVNSEIGSNFFPKVLLSSLRFICFFVCVALSGLVNISKMSFRWKDISLLCCCCLLT